MVSVKKLAKNSKVEKIKNKPKKAKKILEQKNVVIPVEKEKTNEKNSVLKSEKVFKKRKSKSKYTYPSKAVTSDIVDACLEALQKLTEHYNTKNLIFGDENQIFMQISSIKIQKSRGNIRFILPHSTVATSGEVCLITPDLKKGKRQDHEPTIEKWEDILRNAGVTNVKTILPMRQLRVEYDQFELRRRLKTQHDFIMVDTRIINHVSHLLGNMFFKKHNMLVPVRIDERKDVKKHIDIGLRTAVLRLNEGAISTIIVGHTAMPQEHIKENILAIIKQFPEKFPGGEINIRSLSIKLPLSISIPLYMTLRSSNLISAPKKKEQLPKEFKEYEDELSTIPNSRVKIEPDGTVTVKKVKPDKDFNEGNDESNDEDDDEIEEDDSSENEED